MSNVSILLYPGRNSLKHTHWAQPGNLTPGRATKVKHDRHQSVQTGGQRLIDYRPDPVQDHLLLQLSDHRWFQTAFASHESDTYADSLRKTRTLLKTGGDWLRYWF